MPTYGPGSLPPAYTWVDGDTAGEVDAGTGVNLGEFIATNRDQIRALWSTRKNRLVNGSFAVKQRATMPTTDDAYCLDRWILLLEAANGATVAQETSDVPTDGANTGIRLMVGSGEDTKFGIVQILEANDSKDLRGKTVSLQLKMKSTAGITDVRAAVIEWTSTADVVTSDVVGTWGAALTNPTLATNWAYCNTPVSLAPTTSWGTYRIDGITVGASANNLAVLIWCDDETTTQTTDILRITDVQLEEGIVCTNMEWRPIADELSLCEYWLQQLGGVNGVVPFQAMGMVSSTTEAEFGPLVKRRMRAAPTLTITAADWAVYEGVSGTACSSVAILYADPGAVWVRATIGSASLTAFRAAGLSANTGGSYTQMRLSAEL